MIPLIYLFIYFQPQNINHEKGEMATWRTSIMNCSQIYRLSLKAMAQNP